MGTTHSTLADLAGSPKPGDTARRLIDAAGPIFADRGYRDATVREISAAAGANVASINYHFGDKLGLYRAVLLDMHERSRLAHMATVPEDGPAEARLRAWVEAFLRKILDETRPQWQTRLMAREMADPTPALDDVVERSIRPQYEQLSRSVAELLADSTESPAVRRCVTSIVGQCLIHRHCGRAIALLECRGMQGVCPDALARHITAFSLAAIRGLRDAKGGVP
jgi:TetR/AcrR family transcriptional regulator, regulator of cefoperazone and chloramphenicol sensitivity